jgi:hypothetical protein
MRRKRKRKKISVPMKILKTWYICGLSKMFCKIIRSSLEMFVLFPKRFLEGVRKEVNDVWVLGDCTV